VTAVKLKRKQRGCADQIPARMEASVMARMEAVTAKTDGLVTSAKLKRVKNQALNHKQGG